MIDYHMHSHFCRHAVGGLAEYARAACRKGIQEICFTPHVPLPGFRPGFWGDRLRMDEREFDAYRVELEETRAAFPELTILSGLEADYIASMEGWLQRFLSQHAFDFVLMSVHFVSGWRDDEWVFGFASHRALPDAYSDYLREMRRGIETGLFDCVAHLDLIKRPGKPVLATNRDGVEEVLEACLSHGMSVEVNTSGMRKEISLALVEDVAVGDYVIVHVGYALQKLDQEEAERTLAMFAQMSEIDDLSAMNDPPNTPAS